MSEGLKNTIVKLFHLPANCFATRRWQAGCFIVVLLLFLVVGVSAQTNTPTPRLKIATCDLCGYCPPNPIPGNWEKCRKCIYEAASSNPDDLETLKLDTTTFLPPTSVPGKMYTAIGCVSTNLGSFTTPGSAAGVVQTLFNFIVTLAGGAAFLTIIYGSFILITSQSNPEKLDQGKRMVMGAIIGLVFILFSAFIVNFLASQIFNIQGFGTP